MPRDWLKAHPEKARELGRRGGKALRKFGSNPRTGDYKRGYNAGWNSGFNAGLRKAATGGHDGVKATDGREDARGEDDTAARARARSPADEDRAGRRRLDVGRSE